MIHTLPVLEYSYDGLEPFIAAGSVEHHYTKYHQAYVDSLNSSLRESRFQEFELEEIFEKAGEIPQALRHSAGGHYNQSLFWSLVSPGGGGVPKDGLAKDIQRFFGSYSGFQDEFSRIALSNMGQGWIWLAMDKEGFLFITVTQNHDNPLMKDTAQRGFPILGLNLHQHLHCPKFRNGHKEYISGFWKIINWNFAGQLYLKGRALNFQHCIHF